MSETFTHRVPADVANKNSRRGHVEVRLRGQLLQAIRLEKQRRQCVGLGVSAGVHWPYQAKNDVGCMLRDRRGF